MGVQSKMKKPFPVYFMALWAFFGVGSFLSVLCRSAFSENETLLQVSALAVLGISITLAYFLLKFNNHSLRLFGILCVALAAFQLLNIASILLTRGFQPSIYFSLYYVIPSLILAWPAFSNEYQELASQLATNNQQEAMRKTAFKALRR